MSMKTGKDYFFKKYFQNFCEDILEVIKCNISMILKWVTDKK